MVASEPGHQERVRALLAAQADVNAKAGNGGTALMTASQNGRQEVVRALLDARADVNARAGDGGTALMLASQNGHVEAVRALLDARADVNAKAGNGATALMLAAKNGQEEVVQLLKSAGAADRSTTRVRVGGNAQAANLIHKVDPVYPVLAKQARIQGTVRFEAIVGTDGVVSSLQLISGDPLLVDAAKNAVQQWVYRPTLLNGTPVEVTTTIDVNFAL
jgi:TonB family protein